MHPFLTADIATQRREDLMRASTTARRTAALHAATEKNLRRPEAWDRGFVVVPPEQASETVPGRVTVGRARLELDHDHPVHMVRSGLPAVSYRATWSRALLGSQAHVELRPASSYSTDVLLRLEAPRGLGWLPGTKQRLARVARALSDELRSAMSAAVGRDATHDRDRVTRGSLHQRTSPDSGTARPRSLRRPGVRSGR